MTDNQTAADTPQPPEPEALTLDELAPETPSDEARIAALQAQIAELKDQWVRAVADGDNIRKRAQRDVEETAKYSVSRFAKDLVNVVENLDRASQSIPPEMREGDTRLRNLAEGVDMTMQELLATFERHGIKRIFPLGEKFDHNFHQAVAQIEDNTHPPGTVVQVLQAGYVIHDRLLRPAMVGVSKQGETESKIDTTA